MDTDTIRQPDAIQTDCLINDNVGFEELLLQLMQSGLEYDEASTIACFQLEEQKQKNKYAIYEHQINQLKYYDTFVSNTEKTKNNILKREYITEKYTIIEQLMYDLRRRGLNCHSQLQSCLDFNKKHKRAKKINEDTYTEIYAELSTLVEKKRLSEENCDKLMDLIEIQSDYDEDY
jgi:hypothetical protein